MMKQNIDYLLSNDLAKIPSLPQNREEQTCPKRLRKTPNSKMASGDPQSYAIYAYYIHLYAFSFKDQELT